MATTHLGHVLTLRGEYIKFGQCSLMSLGVSHTCWYRTSSSREQGQVATGRRRDIEIRQCDSSPEPASKSSNATALAEYDISIFETLHRLCLFIHASIRFSHPY